MAQLKSITVGSTIKGVAGNEPISVIAVKWFGTSGIELTYNTRINRDVSRLVDEIINHITSLNGSKVEITLEVSA